MKSKRFTVDHLSVLGACTEQVDLFRQVFPDGAPITIRSVTTAWQKELDIEWLITSLPAPARKAFEEAMAPASEAYYEARKTAVALVMAVKMAIAIWDEHDIKLPRNGFQTSTCDAEGDKHKA